ncbi:hypothetical protein Cni_G13156 [Canna indica]|uniref:Uncharacterized protein n=1 Tax=Canna indica TaxID=4628 RepID=A0AAQ3K9L0_9LILI|nr:hypothetical protein Cni_G13156 [Canna indica]
MNARRSSLLMLVLVVLITVVMSSIQTVDAGRRGRFNEASSLAYPSSIYEKTRAAVAMWMARLPSGSNPKGPGH